MPKKKSKRGGVRPGSGRPRQLEEASKLTVLLDATMVVALDTVAARRGLTRSEATRDAVGEWIQRHANGVSSRASERT